MVWNVCWRRVRMQNSDCVSDHYRRVLSLNTGQLLLEHPMIAADLQNPHQPLTAPGIIVEALARRQSRRLTITVMSQGAACRKMGM